MEGLEIREQLLKIMWLPGEKSKVWDMKTEEAIDINSMAYTTLTNFIDIDNWAQEYGVLYEQWLNDDYMEVFNLKNETFNKLLKALKKINTRKSNKFLYFLWYDKDRTFNNDDFVWDTSPISGDKLTDLGTQYHFLNRLVSFKDHIVFPKYPTLIRGNS